MTNSTEIVDTYLAHLNASDPTASRPLVERAWAPDGRFIDPLFDVTGHDGLAGIGAAVAAQYPGHQFRRTTAIDAHHNLLRYGWEFVAPDRTVVLAGLDVAELGPDGRLARVTGFFGPLAAA